MRSAEQIVRLSAFDRESRPNVFEWSQPGTLATPETRLFFVFCNSFMHLHLEWIMYRPSLAPTVLLSTLRLEANSAFGTGQESVLPANQPDPTVQPRSVGKTRNAEQLVIAGAVG